jgi:hypothetical protein
LPAWATYGPGFCTGSVPKFVSGLKAESIPSWSWKPTYALFLCHQDLHWKVATGQPIVGCSRSTAPCKVQEYSYSASENGRQPPVRVSVLLSQSLVKQRH